MSLFTPNSFALAFDTNHHDQALGTLFRSLDVSTHNNPLFEFQKQRGSMGSEYLDSLSKIQSPAGFKKVEPERDHVLSPGNPDRGMSS